MVTRMAMKSMRRFLAAQASMLEFRVTKYDPAHRDARGVFTREEWTSVSDIGRRFEAGVLGEAEYRRVEGAYATAAIEPV